MIMRAHEMRINHPGFIRVLQFKRNFVLGALGALK